MAEDNKADADRYSHCIQCDLIYPSPQALHLHKIMSDRHFACPHCGLEWLSQGGLEFHMRHNHPETREMACAGCGSKFKSACAVIQHIEDMKCPVVGTPKEPLKFGKIYRPEIMCLRNGGALPEPQPLQDADSSDSSQDNDADGGVPLHATSGNMEDKASTPNVRWTAEGTHFRPDFSKHRGTAHSRIHRANFEEFWNPDEDLFYCDCGESFKYVTAFQYHLGFPLEMKPTREEEQHNSCPRCSKRFASLAALVAHMEARYSRCGLRASDAKFEQALDDVMRGLAKACVESEQKEIEFGVSSQSKHNTPESSIGGLLLHEASPTKVAPVTQILALRLNLLGEPCGRQQGGAVELEMRMYL
ncbi:uncharacterized protein N7515_009504 [Penicillium bovifimosum]|uniref:C2H2-type domain-containing protein n=1 Tax=Penicillium bovifimosum TaxID=126998 RepID=A0A9W9GJF2_9EURO|nr:uncharacterized protein N7515_009504 [Penicillium bovifimosum]KAJ5121543.1 hypothetical protein N7515_009504 [Penicillium bovifimosum]